MVEGGDIHLAGIQRLAAHLTEDNHKDVLLRASGKSVRDVERLVAELCPKPDIPSSLRKVPERTGTQKPARAATPVPTCGLRSTQPSPPLPATLVPLAPARYSLRVTLAEEAADHLRQLQDLLAHAIPSRDPAEILARALKGLLRDTHAKKAALTDRPRASAGATTRTRHIPAAVKREVFTRDSGQCTYRDDRGRRCTSRSFIEFHHRQNFAWGGTHEPANLELRCRVHNAYQAELDYGRDFIERARRLG
jgi:hypothetical protein